MIRQLWLAARHLPRGRMLEDPVTGSGIFAERDRGFLTLAIADAPESGDQAQRREATVTRYMLGFLASSVPAPLFRHIEPLYEHSPAPMSRRQARTLLRFNDLTGVAEATPAELASSQAQICADVVHVQQGSQYGVRRDFISGREHIGAGGQFAGSLPPRRDDLFPAGHGAQGGVVVTRISQDLGHRLKYCRCRFPVDHVVVLAAELVVIHPGRMSDADVKRLRIVAGVSWLVTGVSPSWLAAPAPSVRRAARPTSAPRAPGDPRPDPGVRGPRAEPARSRGVSVRLPGGAADMPGTRSTRWPKAEVTTVAWCSWRR